MNFVIMKRLLILIAFIICVGSEATIGRAQPPSQATSRSDEIRNERMAKETAVRPDDPGRAERAFVRVQDIAEMFTSSPSGLRAKLSSAAPGWDGLVLGSGFSVGAEYRRIDLASGEVALRTSAVGTTKASYLFDAQLTFPRLGGDRVTVDT